MKYKASVAKVQKDGESGKGKVKKRTLRLVAVDITQRDIDRHGSVRQAVKKKVELPNPGWIMKDYQRA